MALPTHFPVCRSQRKVVSRWLVRPMAAMSPGCDVPRIDSAQMNRLLQRGHLAVQDVLRIVLHPPRVRIMLRKFHRMGGDNHALLRKDNRSGAGCSLIQCHQVFCHVFLLLPNGMTPLRGLCPSSSTQSGCRKCCSCSFPRSRSPAFRHKPPDSPRWRRRSPGRPVPCRSARPASGRCRLRRTE